MEFLTARKDIKHTQSIFGNKDFVLEDYGQHESYLLSSVPKQKGKLLQDEISEHIELLQNYRKQYICY